MGNVSDLQPWGVYVFSWGAAVRHRKGKWTHVVLNNGQQINVENLSVILHQNGIEFVEGGTKNDDT